MSARLCVLLVALVVLASASLVSAAPPQPQASLLGPVLPGGPVLTLPVGEDGLHYAPQRPESLPWGPTALAVAPDGSFWIADAAANRLLHYAAGGLPLGTVDLSADPLRVVGAGDIAVDNDNTVFVLDIAAMRPAILRLAADGSLLWRSELPEELSLASGLSGIALDDAGQVLVELEGGAHVVRLPSSDSATAPSLPDGYVLGGRPYQVQAPDPASPDRSAGRIATADAVIEVRTEAQLGAVSLLGAAPDEGFYAELEEVAVVAGRIQVDKTVRHYSADGRLVGVARVPVAEQYVYVPHSVALGPDGQVYALVTRPDRIEVRRLEFVSELAPVLSAVDAAGVASRPEGKPKPSPCITRASMMAIATAYTGNLKYLSQTNVSGACSGRTAPRYLGTGPDTYASVPYDWGGWDSVAGYNGYMDPGIYQAGDINTAAVESCSKGVDCSGFVTRVWQLTTKYSTSTLPRISTTLSSTAALTPGDILNDAGSHVVLFDAFADNGVWDYESTQYSAFDRVVYMFSSWTRLNGYAPRRYNNVCAN
jgi:hypothetical protein